MTRRDVLVMAAGSLAGAAVGGIAARAGAPWWAAVCAAAMVAVLVAYAGGFLGRPDADSRAWTVLRWLLVQLHSKRADVFAVVAGAVLTGIVGRLAGWGVTATIAGGAIGTLFWLGLFAGIRTALHVMDSLDLDDVAGPQLPAPDDDAPRDGAP